ncbi:helix-turn-helix transcriptional regulator [Oceanobacillus oncorhynchi]|uniref:helix-turn-helix transcriptional regulator n=1 Tax=Oceanobacillus oncorhynchi TaxID=545501 RepID=UPI001866AD1A|nr:helix-turn-helix transcriptional regulator [Oceanobacillus oncorhynchi]
MALDKLKHFRNKFGLTYKEVADRIGISKEHYWMIENGKRRLNYDLAVKIARVFNMKPDDIFLNDELTTSEQTV